MVCYHVVHAFPANSSTRLTTNDVCFLLKSLCRPRMDTVLQNVDQCSDPPRLVTFHVHSVSISEQ